MTVAFMGKNGVEIGIGWEGNVLRCRWIGQAESDGHQKSAPSAENKGRRPEWHEDKAD